LVAAPPELTPASPLSFSFLFPSVLSPHERVRFAGVEASLPWRLGFFFPSIGGAPPSGRAHPRSSEVMPTSGSFPARWRSNPAGIKQTPVVVTTGNKIQIGLFPSGLFPSVLFSVLGLGFGFSFSNRIQFFFIFALPY
jgi:hypothetical protein